MKKLLVLACATSALALASGANADTTWSGTGTGSPHSTAVKLGANVPSTCTLSIPVPHDTGTGTMHPLPRRASARWTLITPTLSMPALTLLVRPNGVKFPVSTNGSCDFELSATNGSLNGGTGSNIPYGAAISSVDNTDAASLAAANVGSNNLAVTSQKLAAVNTAGVADVYFAFNIPADFTGTYGAFLPGAYADTLQVKLTPHS